MTFNSRLAFLVFFVCCCFAVILLRHFVSDKPTQQPLLLSDGRLPLSIIVIDYQSPLSFNASVRSYMKNELFAMVQESLLYAQQIQNYSMDSLHLANEAAFTKIRFSFVNTYIHGAILAAIDEVTADYVLILEKDFQLVENAEITRQRLISAISLLRSNNDIKVVRMKSRQKPGVPEFGRVLYQYNEAELLAKTEKERDLICQVLYWKDDNFIDEHVSRAHMWRCPEDPSYWCSSTSACHWTNQAPLFERKWFVEHMRPALAVAKPEYDNEYQRHHCFEIMCRYERGGCAWERTRWIVALGDGLFSHRDIEKYPYDWRVEDEWYP